MSNIVKLREVLVYNQPKQKFFKFETATDKWAELAELVKNEPSLEVDNINNMRAVIQSTQNTLELPNALIPDGPQKIFLFESKVKSGVNYDKLSYNDLRKLAKSKNLSEGLGSNPTRDQLLDKLEGSAGIKKEKISKTSPKTGRTTTKVVKKESSTTASSRVKDREILDNQPSLKERQDALEAGFERLIGGLHELCSDFIKPPVKNVSVIKENTTISDLEKESRELAIKN